MSRSSLYTITIILLVLIGAGIYTFSKMQSETGSDAARSLTGDSEYVIEYTDLNDNPLSLEQFEGKVRVVNAWATWCPFCINELPDFALLAEEFKDEEVVVIAINRKEDSARAKAFIESIGGLDNIVFVQDSEDAFYKSIGGFSMPETVFFDKDGNISSHKKGFMKLSEMRERTNAALNASNE